MYDEDYLDFDILFDDEFDDELAHVGVSILDGAPGRGSGRYAYGSGEEPYQHAMDFLGRVDVLQREGLSEGEIAKSMGLKSVQLRAQISLAKSEKKNIDYQMALKLKEQGMSNAKIAQELGYPNESSVRSLMNQDSAKRRAAAQETADFLRKQVDEKGMIDVGKGVNLELNVSKEKLDQAIEILRMEGYELHGGRMPQVANSSQSTTLSVLCKPGTPHKEIFEYGNVKPVIDYITRDGGETYEKKFHYPESLDSKRLMIRYADDVGADGAKGIEKDGVIELRRGLADLSLGESRYAQVRILVDNDRYLKGMAVYSDDMPDGVDVVFNTNKTKDVVMRDVLKKIKNDPTNPFGSAIKEQEKGGQYWYNPETGERCSASTPNAKLGLINKRSDEGDWSDWKDKLPSQFLSKQPIALARQQIKLAEESKMNELKSIMELTNPTVKKSLLETFANDCDSTAVHLHAAALPRQKYHVILPLASMKENEVYAPNYTDGEEVALIRYPHGGTFEIPLLKVTTKNPLAKQLIGSDNKDAICINSKVAERLSGADFDGDTVMVIPNNGLIKIRNTEPLEQLKGFDPKTEYAYDKVTVDKDGTEHYYRNGNEFKVMKNTGNEMGKISNLITDMTIKGAGNDELARAVRHSMVVIDAEKHKLDYKTSYAVEGIEALKKKYQGHVDEDGKYRQGASTILSRAKSEVSIAKTQGTPKINTKGTEWYDPTKPEGALIYKTAVDLYYPDRMYDKTTGTTTVRLLDGKKFTYTQADRDKYDVATTKDPKTGKKVDVTSVDPDTGEVYFLSKDGTKKYRSKMKTQESTRMEETDDAYSLVSTKDGTPKMEILYADYANKMKSLANQARKEMVSAGKIQYSAEAKKQYQKEYDSLSSQVIKAKKNMPRERQANAIANAKIKAIKLANPDIKKDELKKQKQRAITEARNAVGAQRYKFNITEKEWEAIQAGAISETLLKDVIKYADKDQVRQYATPRSSRTLTSAQQSQIRTKLAAGYTPAQIAAQLGISTSTVHKYSKE